MYVLVLAAGGIYGPFHSKEQAKFYQEEEFPGHPHSIQIITSPRIGYRSL